MKSDGLFYVLLRNGSEADIEQIPVEAAEGEWFWIGTVCGFEAADIWTEKGHWLNDHTEHPRDIVGGLPLQAGAPGAQPGTIQESDNPTQTT